ncbi:MAG: hypothetical protein CL784_03355 [Chloroflexi bacterium]|nr:hypothetical protein [Chloroflexota bacterium]
MRQLPGLNGAVKVAPLAATATHIAIGFTHGGPVAVPDVTAYLNIAQRLWGGIPITDLPYHPGYGIVIGPFGFLQGDAVHTAALCVNAALAGLTVWMVQRLLRYFAAPRSVLWFGTAIACLHPSITHGSRVAWPEVLLAVTLLWIALLIGNPDVQRWWIAGCVAGLAPMMHPRAIVITAAMLIVGCLSGRARRTAVGIATGLVGTLVVLQLTDTWQAARANAAQHMGSEPGPLATGAGQWLAFTATTAGLGAVGVLTGLTLLRRRNKVSPEQNVLRFFTLGAVGMLVLGAWVLAGSARPDTLLYGRYMDPWTVPVTVSFLCVIVSRIPSRRLITVAAATVVLSFLIAVLETNHATQTARGVMTASLRVVWLLADEKLPLTLLLATALSLIGICGFRRYFRPTLIGLLVAASLSTLLTHTHLRDVGQVADGQMTTTQLLPDTVECLSHDRSSTKPYAVWLYRLQLPNIEHTVIDLSRGEAPCENYVIAGHNALKSCQGSEFLGKEPRAQWGLWRYPLNTCG